MEGGLFAFAMFMAVFGIFFIIIGIVMYILLALGLYTLAQKRNIENPWLAWIPIVGQAFILGKLVGCEVNIGSWKIEKLDMVLLIGSIIVLVLSWVPVLNVILGIAYAVLYFFALHKLFTIYKPDQAVLWLVLSIILSFMGPIFIFIMRNEEPKIDAGATSVGA
ncbi:MAG: hypothetical protein ACOYEJ_06525 [Mahellales bacterium]|jgi:hypothetical protein